MSRLPREILIRPVITEESSRLQFNPGRTRTRHQDKEGEIQPQFVFQVSRDATKIEIKSSTDIRVAGLVDAVSTENDTVTILNITVNTSNTTTRFEDKSNAGIDPFGIGEINVADYIEARGQESPTGEITAVLVERDDPDPDSELRGFTDPASVVTDSGAPGYRESFVILGVTVDTGSVEVYRDVNNNELSADEFWAVIEIEAAGLEFEELASAEHFLRVPEVAVKGGRIDLENRDITVAEARFTGGRAGLWAEGEKGLNWVRVFRRNQEAAEPLPGPGSGRGECRWPRRACRGWPPLFPGGK